ncbi:MAG: helix-turn-helix transcriptional regulator [Chitinophagaceae bacterium]|nr:helix-turn-helix transcriptional regulator [Chitinophagaceae bacterium]
MLIGYSKMSSTVKFTCEEIRLLRASRQMKQEVVAQIMGITKQRYSKLENHHNLNYEKVLEILKALGYTPQSAREYLDSIPPPSKKYFA